MTDCPTCGAHLSALCKDCGNPLKRLILRENGWAQWIHAGESLQYAGEGAWVRCPSRGEPRPV